MKFSIQREVFLQPLSQVVGVVERRQTLPVLANFLLVARDGKLSVTGTDMEVELIGSVETSVSQDGEITVPARKLVDIVRALPDGSSIDFSVADEKATLSAAKMSSPGLRFDASFALRTARCSATSVTSMSDENDSSTSNCMTSNGMFDLIRSISRCMAWRVSGFTSEKIPFLVVHQQVTQAVLADNRSIQCDHGGHKRTVEVYLAIFHAHDFMRNILSMLIGNE